MDNGEDFENYCFEKNDLQENNWNFPKFVPPSDQSYKDSKYIKDFHSRNLSLVSRCNKVFIKDTSFESGTSTPFSFKPIPDFDGFLEHSQVLPYKEHNYQFEKCLQRLENNEFKNVMDLPFYDVTDNLLNLDVEEGNIINVVPFPDSDYVDNDDDDDDALAVTFFKLKGASKFGHDLLVDNFGYTYSLLKTKYENDEFIFRQTWRCIKRTGYRGNKIQCAAVVKIVPDSNDFSSYKYVKLDEHNHESDGNFLDLRQMRKEIKEKCLNDPMVNPKALIQEYFVDKVDFKDFCSQSNNISINALIQMIKRERIKYAPPRVRDILFDIQLEHLPSSFLRADIMVGHDARHLIFFSDEQLYYLGHQKMWFIDGTFKIIAPPFMQLLTINVYVYYNDNKLVIPVCYIFMSRRRKIDYVEVFTSLANIIQAFLLKSPDVQVVMCDFERAFWSAWRHMLQRRVYEDVILRGCYFHFTQAVFRKIVNFGLKQRYFYDVGSKHFCKKLMALPLLPQADISIEFSKLELQVKNLKIDKLIKLTDYMKKNWIEGRMWSVPDFCQYRMKIRTNNDIEGSHNSLMATSRIGNVSFYNLVKQLYTNAQYAKYNVVRLWSNECLTRRKRKVVKREQLLSMLWEKLDLRVMNATEFLDCYAKDVIVNEEFAANESRIDLEDEEDED